MTHSEIKSPLKVCEQDVIDSMTNISEPFFEHILDLSLSQCLLTDESELSDFAGSGAPVEMLEGCASLRDFNKKWDAFVLSRIEARYGIELKTTKVKLIELFERIRLSQKAVTLH